jgi:hypothetical protein
MHASILNDEGCHVRVSVRFFALDGSVVLYLDVSNEVLHMYVILSNFKMPNDKILKSK